MARRSKYFKVVEHLMETGYEAKDIVKISGIPRATVYRIVDKLRDEAKLNFKELMEKDYLYKYQKNLQELNKTVIECNEEIKRVNDRYDILERRTEEMLDMVEDNKHVSKATFLQNLIACRSGRTNEIARLIQQRDRASSEKATLYNKGPVVYRINQYVQDKMANVPQMLNKVETAKETLPEIVENEIIDNKVVEISEEDQAILDEMEQDES